MNQENSFYDQSFNSQIKSDLVGGLLYIGENSTVSSYKNKYLNARADIGGCVAMAFGSSATFE